MEFYQVFWLSAVILAIQNRNSIQSHADKRLFTYNVHGFAKKKMTHCIQWWIYRCINVCMSIICIYVINSVWSYRLRELWNWLAFCTVQVVCETSRRFENESCSRCICSLRAIFGTFDLCRTYIYRSYMLAREFSVSPTVAFCICAHITRIVLRVTSCLLCNEFKSIGGPSSVYIGDIQCRVERCNTFAFNGAQLSWELFLFFSLCHTPFCSCITKVSCICRYKFVSFSYVFFFYYFIISLAHCKRKNCVNKPTSVCAFCVRALAFFCLRVFKSRAFEILTWRWIVKIWTRVVRSLTKPVAAEAICAVCWDLCARCGSHYLSCLWHRWNLFAYKGFPLFRYFFLCQNEDVSFKRTNKQILIFYLEQIPKHEGLLSFKSPQWCGVVAKSVLCELDVFFLYWKVLGRTEEADVASTYSCMKSNVHLAIFSSCHFPFCFILVFTSLGLELKLYHIYLETSLWEQRAHDKYIFLR